jgi:polyphenol oxidase
MPFEQKSSIRYYSAASLSEHPDIYHAFLTRRGGVSQGYWQSLNLGGSVGDDPQHVAYNKTLALQAFDRQIDSIFDVWQVHGSDVILANKPRQAGEPPQKADIILTNQPDITLMMRFADCVPILLYDPVRRVVGLAHAGWQGTVKKIALHAVQAMQVNYASHAKDIKAVIGPSIGPEHYQVGNDVVEQVHAAFGKRAEEFLVSINGGTNFNLWAANQRLLEEAGVRQIEIVGVCTACHPEDWFSHRGDKGKTGRFGVLIGLSV